MKVRTVIIRDEPNQGYRFPVTFDGLHDALSHDHTCTDSGCDIATARHHGFVVTAARLLQGATDCEATELVLSALAFNGEDIGTHTYDSPDWEGWEAYHKEHGVKCESCNSYTYGDDAWRPTQCANCLESLPDPDDELSDDAHRVDALADEEIEAWSSFVSELRERSGRFRR